MSQRPPTGYFGKTYCLDFTVTGSLDGTTVSPTVDDSPPSAQNPGDPQNFFRREVENLGLIDPDYLPAQDEDERRGTRGLRLVAFLWVSGPNAGEAGASVEIVDAVEGAPVTQEPVGSLEGRLTLFRRALFIPQGSMIRLDGMNADPGSPIIVRLHVQYLDNAEDIALALQAAEDANPPETFLQQFGAWLAATTPIPGASLTPMPLDTLFIPFDPNVYDHTLGSSDVTVLQSGRYIIETQATIDNTSGSSRTTSLGLLFVDTGSGFAIVFGSLTFGYHRNAANGEGVLPTFAILDLPAGAVIRFAAIRIAGAGTLSYVGSSCRTRITRVPTL